MSAPPATAAPPTTQLSAAPTLWRARFHACLTISRRDLLPALTAPGGYVAVTIGLAVAALSVRNHLEVIARDGLLVLTDAFTLPLFIAALVLALYLSIVAAAAIARERESGALEVLFYGPVDSVAYVVGKQLMLLASYLAFGSGLVVSLWLMAVLTGLPTGVAFPAAGVLSIGAAAALTAIGLLCSAMMRGTRSAVALLLALGLLLAGVSLGASLLSDVPVANNTGPVLWLRDVVIGGERLLTWVSPVSAFERGIDAMHRRDIAAYGGSLVVLLGQCALALAGAMVAVQRRGVRR